MKFRTIGCLFGFILTALIILPQKAEAAPHFTVEGSTALRNGYFYTYSVYLYTDSETVTVAQTVVNVDPGAVEIVSVSNLSSRCSFWAPADPSAGFGNSSTPYIYNESQIVLACGFINPGYKSTTPPRDLIAKFVLKPISLVDTSANITLSNVLLKYVGTTLPPGVSTGLNLGVYYSLIPTPTQVPTPTPVNARTISAADLNIVDLGSSGSARSAAIQNSQNQDYSAQAQTNVASSSALNALNPDDKIPAPPQMTPRPSNTPFINPTKLPDKPIMGEILSGQSFKELFIPGKTSADKTVVFVNLITTSAFLVILTILLWRLFTLKRLNKIKQQHVAQIIEGEMAVMLGKNATADDTHKQEMVGQLDEIKKEIEGD